MDHAVIWQDLWAVGSVLGLVLVGQLYAIWRMFDAMRSRAETNSKELHGRISNSNKALDAYKLEAQDKFAKVDRVDQVERDLNSKVTDVMVMLAGMNTTLTRIETLLEERERERNKERERAAQ